MEPIWVRNEVVSAIHRRQIAEHGGSDGVRDPGLLESALCKPKNLYLYGEPKPTLEAMAASYAFGIVSNHPFMDGNKRTAFIVCRLFLKLNGLDLTATPEDKFVTFLNFAAGDLSEQSLTEWIKQNSREWVP